MTNSRSPLEVRVYHQEDLTVALPDLEAFALRQNPRLELSRHPACALALARGLGHKPIVLAALEGQVVRGFLGLVAVHSWLFGRFLVSLPYLNYGGILAEDERAAAALTDKAIELARQLRVRYLELRHERELPHPSFLHARRDKVHMRLKLANTKEDLWKSIPSSVRNQVRKGEKNNLQATWGTMDCLDGFYQVFSRNMRDLGTPVYPKSLFASILQQFPDRAEICLVKQGDMPLAGALLMHGWNVTEVPSASSLRTHNHTCANMFMYWQLLARSVERGQSCFDFGRATPDSGTYKFKKQWGAESFPAAWQYASFSGEVGSLRPDNPKYRAFIWVWKKLPVSVTRWLGPPIVRGIP